MPTQPHAALPLQHRPTLLFLYTTASCRPTLSRLSTAGSTPSCSLSVVRLCPTSLARPPHLHHKLTKTHVAAARILDLGSVRLGRVILLCLWLGKGTDAAEVTVGLCREDKRTKKEP